MLVNNQEKIIDLYEMMFKRKSIRKFDKNLSVSNQELEKLKNGINNLVPLVDNINVAFVIADRKETTAQRGEYCLLMYSEEKPFYLQNVGICLSKWIYF